MGKLIIDGNSVFEIDEECLKKRKPSTNCDLDKYFVSEDSFCEGETESKQKIYNK